MNLLTAFSITILSGRVSRYNHNMVRTKTHFKVPVEEAGGFETNLNLVAKLIVEVRPNIYEGTLAVDFIQRKTPCIH